MCEAFESHHITVANHFLDGLFEWKNVSQIVIMPRPVAFAVAFLVSLVSLIFKTIEEVVRQRATTVSWSGLGQK